MRFGLRISDTLVDLYTDEVVQLTRELKDAVKLGRVKTEYTQQFTIPSTDTNDGVFHSYSEEDIDLGSWNPYLKLDARIEIHSIPIFDGCIELRGVRYKKGRPQSYSLIFYGEVKSAYADFGEKTLIDVDWSDYDHLVNYTNVTDTWDQSFVPGSGNAGDILYPVVDYHRGFVYSTGRLPNNVAFSDSGYAIN